MGEADGTASSWNPPNGSEISIGNLVNVYGEAQNLAGSCPAVKYAQLWNGPVTGSANAQVNGVFTGAFERMLPNVNSAAGGSVFEPIAIGSNDSDTPSIPVTAFGVRHRTWGQSGSVRFSVRVNYLPSEGTLAMAMRYKNYNGSPAGGVCYDPKARVKIECINGCITNPVSEPGTGWVVMPVLPQRTLDIRLSFNSCLEQFPPCAGPKNSIIPHVFEETVETIEIGGREERVFAKVDPLDLVQVNGSRVENGLLTYIAALGRESDPGGWLAPEVAQIERATMLSRARIAILQRLGDLPVEDIKKNLRPELLDNSSDIYIRSPWLERQESLRILLPSLRRKIEHNYRDSLAAGIASAAIGLDNLNEAHRQLTDAVRQLAAIDLAGLDRIVSGAADKLHKPKPESMPTSQLVLEAAVVGASSSVDNALEQILTAQRLRCEVWHSFDWNYLPTDDLTRVTDGFCQAWPASGTPGGGGESTSASSVER